MPIDTAHTALLLMDLQNEMVDPKGYFGAMGMAKAVAERDVLGRARKVLDAARTKQMPVVFVRLAFRPDYSDSLSVAPRVAKFKAAGAAVLGNFGTDFPDVLKPLPTEMIVNKQCVNPFFNTGLLTWLMSRGIKRLVLAGVSTNNVVEACTRYADDAGFAVTILEDCCAAANLDLHRFAVEKILPGFGEVTSSEAFLGTL